MAVVLVDIDDFVTSGHYKLTNEELAAKTDRFRRRSLLQRTIRVRPAVAHSTGKSNEAEERVIPGKLTPQALAGETQRQVK